MYQGDVLNTLDGTNPLGERHVLVVAEHFHGHLHMVATHGFGFDEELRAAERARDVVPDRVGSVMDHRDVHAALVLMRIEHVNLQLRIIRAYEMR